MKHKKTKVRKNPETDITDSKLTIVKQNKSIAKSHPINQKKEKRSVPINNYVKKT